MFKLLQRTHHNARFPASNLLARTSGVRHSSGGDNSKPRPAAAIESESFAMNIFRGQIQPKQVFPYPKVLSEDQNETLQMLIDPLDKFFKETNNALKNDELNDVEPESLQQVKEMGGFGLQVPQEYGGIGLNNTQYARLVEIVGKHDLGFGIALGAHQSIGFKGILLYGTDAQKAKYLPKVSSCEWFAAFALTEPSSGSDASSIKTRAVLSDDGKHFILNGSKIWISNGGLAEVFTVFCQVSCKDAKTGEMKDKVTAMIVQRSFGGVTNGEKEMKMGIKASNTTEVYFDDVKVPVENVLGEVGEGFKIAMNILNNGRFGMAACLSGTMKTCIDKAVDHATNRTQFGKKIHNYGAIQEKIGNMMLAQYATESMAYMISGNMDSGSKEYQIEAAISKIYASEAAWFCCDEAIQILGGMGYMRETGLEKIMRDLRIFRIFEGTNDILRLFVSLTGIQFAGSHLKEIQKAFKNPASNFGIVMGEGTKRAIRAIGLNSTPNLSNQVDQRVGGAATLTAKAIDLYGVSVEQLLIKHGKSIIEQQFELTRLANAAIDIYAMAAVLSRTTSLLKLASSQEDDARIQGHEVMLCNTFCNQASKRISTNLGELTSSVSLQNFKNLSQISQDIVSNEQIIPQHPLGF